MNNEQRPRQGVWRSFWEYFWRSADEETADPERTVEAAWLPLWQSQMITDELIASGIPAVVTDDFGLNMTMYSREPMARIFVTQDRVVEATAVIEEIIGHPPRHRPL
ncbi:MAG: hypothetical protein AB8G14_07010 [Ilumatobacter sp.]